MATEQRSSSPVAARLGRAVARALVITGAAFWVLAALAGPYVYPDVTLAQSARTTVWPLLTTLVILGLGWRHEQLAAVLLTGASAAAVVWGVIYDWPGGTWLFMLAVLVVPMAIAAFLFALSAGDDGAP